MKIGDRIRSLREQLGMSQEDLAIKLGYKSRSSINKIEMGKNDITQSKIVDFASALGTTPAFLMGWEDELSADDDQSSAILADIDIGQAIQRRRKERKMSREQLGKFADVSASTIARYESGKKEIPLEILLNLVAGLQISLTDLIYYEKVHLGLIELDLTHGMRRIMFPEQEAVSRLFSRLGFDLRIVDGEFYFQGNSGYYLLSEAEVNDIVQKALDNAELLCLKLERQCRDRQKYICTFNRLSMKDEMHLDESNK